MTRRQRTVFEDASWKTHPWNGRSKTLKDRLLNILVDIPGYMEDLDSLYTYTCRAERLEQRSILLRKCRKTDLDRLSWELEAGSKIQKFDYVVTGLPVTGLSKAEDLHLLHLTCFYWAMCIQLKIVIKSLLSEDSPSDASQTDTEGVSISHLDADRYAYKIAHCVHLHFEPLAGGLGANLGIMPLAVAWLYLEGRAIEKGRESEELNLLHDLLAKPALGLYVRRFLDSLRYIVSR